MAAFVTSKRFRLPDTPDELTNGKWFNMWTKRLWPYNELEPGDTLLWYESPNRVIVWRSKVVDVNRFPYEEKNTVAERLNLTPGQAAQPYFLDGPESGFCLWYNVEALERLNLSKPDDFRFPQVGWLRIDGDVATEWPALASYAQ
jgi:hypothetical protein